MSKIKQILIAFFVPLILAGLTFFLISKIEEYERKHYFTLYDDYTILGGEFYGLMFFGFIALAFILPIFILTRRKSIKRTEIKLND